MTPWHLDRIRTDHGNDYVDALLADHASDDYDRRRDAALLAQANVNTRYAAPLYPHPIKEKA